MNTHKSTMIIAILTMLSCLKLIAQTTDNQITLEQRKPDFVAVNENMAVNLIFPFAIKRAQWVSSNIAVQQFKGVDNILLVKANKKDFPLTNISVVTTDEQFYSFVIGYAANISALNLEYKISADGRISPPIPTAAANEAEVKMLAEKAMKEKVGFRKISKKKNGLEFSLQAIFINKNTMFYRLLVTNSTNVQYDIDQLRFYVRDEKKSKRTSSQEIEMLPVYRLGSVNTVFGKRSLRFVYALEKFTIPDKKYMTVEIMEKSGGRHLELKVKNNKVLQAVSL